MGESTEEVAELIRRCRAGEPQARADLFERYRHYLLLLARNQLGRKLQARCEPSDLVQQTLLEAHRDFEAFTGQREVELLGWLRRILANNLYNQARYHAAQQRAADREVSLEQLQARLDDSAMALVNCLAGDSPTPSTLAAKHEAAVRVADAVARLPPDYQTVLLLRIFEGLPAEEVATRMKRSAAAVRMLQLRALTALRELVNTV